MPSVRIVAKLAELAFHFALSGFEKRTANMQVTFELLAFGSSPYNRNAPRIHQLGSAQCGHIGWDAHHLTRERKGKGMKHIDAFPCAAEGDESSDSVGGLIVVDFREPTYCLFLPAIS